MADFVYINDCLKSSKEKCIEQNEASISDVCIHLLMVRNGEPDPYLQRELRNRLRLLENDNKEVASVFSELSARLLSIDSDKDLITVTFKTSEEIWKFSTYYSLGFINHCLENTFLDQTFWLSAPEDDDPEIQVYINEDTLNLIYKNLLMEEGTFFVSCSDNQIRQAAVVDNVLHFIHSDSANNGFNTEWSQTKNSMVENQPLSTNTTADPLCPFHQWFLKINEFSELSNFRHSQQKNKVALGLCEAVVTSESDVPDEISHQTGDVIEIVGTFIECLMWFVGRNMTTGKTGFVRTNNVKPHSTKKWHESLSSPVRNEENVFNRSENKFTLKKSNDLLLKISNADVCNLYRLEVTNSIPNAEADNLKQKMESFLQNHNEKHSPAIEVADDPEKMNNSTPEQDDATHKGSHSLNICISEEQEKNGYMQTLLSFLNSEIYLPGFRCLYDTSHTFLHVLFCGYKEEEELVKYLSVAREAAKKLNMTAALTRICFLLGRLCSKLQKFSQARVYYEEAMGVLNGGFQDIFLTSAIYSNLISIYLKQKHKEKCSCMIDKACCLLIGLQSYVSSTEAESVIIKHALKTSIVNQDVFTETRSCYLLVQLYVSYRKYDEALPFIERLQILSNNMDSKQWSLPGYHLLLADIYSHKCLPHLALSCVKVSSHRSCCFIDSMRRVDFVIKNASNLCGIKKGRKSFPTQIAYYLRKALTSSDTEQEHMLCTSIYLSLYQLCISHKEYKKAKTYILKAVDTGIFINRKCRGDIVISLAWLYMLNREHMTALDILNTVMKLHSFSRVQTGIIYNLSAIALKQTDRIKEAAQHYFRAFQLSKETAILQNQAVALANIGTLCLHLRASNLAEHFLVKAVSVYSRLPTLDDGVDFVHLLLTLGYYYTSGIQKEKGRIYYEWAFLVAMQINQLECQLQAVQLLCHFYKSILINEAQCIIYNKYQLSLARKMSDKNLEGQVLEAMSHLYLSLGTERACRSALEYTKRSLGIFIDLQRKEKEAYAWLWAGKIYYILGQNELVDLYIQVAQNVALCTGEPDLGMQLFEAAGDIFFNGANDRDKAVSFYRDRALPLAVKTVDVKAELRLCNKLIELLMSMNNYGDALEPAKRALELSVSLGNLLNERVSYHRLARIYSHLGQWELAEHFYLKALSLCSSPMELEEEALYYMKVYFTLGDIIFYDLKDPFDAAGYYHLALAAAMDLGNKKTQLKVSTRLAVIYHNFLADREKSLFFYQKARTLASELNVRRTSLSPGQNYQTTTSTAVK
ncbi:hypothetical protein GDO86_000183 [Hymenochirus boettgeri]|uniref:SH3 domain-containing protein n=1 Tax=Hymenochirus boettgeri TaxID=247094 RepID=A0A8T2KC47_9PIPI|nr:hypothetical protein GDO86_000183 [Hymenochirus boettgeri]